MVKVLVYAVAWGESFFVVSSITYLEASERELYPAAYLPQGKIGSFCWLWVAFQQSDPAARAGL
jgi:hypothetical protein